MEMKAWTSDDQPLECAMSYVLDGGAANQSLRPPHGGVGDVCLVAAAAMMLALAQQLVVTAGTAGTAGFLWQSRYR